MWGQSNWRCLLIALSVTKTSVSRWFWLITFSLVEEGDDDDEFEDEDDYGLQDDRDDDCDDDEEDMEDECEYLEG